MCSVESSVTKERKTQNLVENNNFFYKSANNARLSCECIGARIHTHSETSTCVPCVYPRACVRGLGNGPDSRGWEEEKERKGMGYSESISAHTVITTTENSGHNVHRKYNEQSRTRSRGWYVDHPK